MNEAIQFEFSMTDIYEGLGELLTAYLYDTLQSLVKVDNTLHFRDLLPMNF